MDPDLAVASLTVGASPLTDRKAHVLALAADGGTAAGIAAEAYLSEGTVRNHLSSSIGKTGARGPRRSGSPARTGGCDGGRAATAAAGCPAFRLTRPVT
ncbi:hypothetical protein GCM10028784_26550 [Myceligenerans cantabricum]